MTPSPNKKIQMWTDGSVDHNPGHVGGWGVVLVDGDYKRILSGWFSGHRTTNNQAETSALLGGLQALLVPCEVHLYTDSVYVIRGVGALRNGKVLETNTELWLEIKPFLGQHAIYCHHVDGHDGAPFNEWADLLAGEAVEHKTGVDKYVTELPQTIKGRCQKAEARRKKRRSKDQGR